MAHIWQFDGATWVRQPLSGRLFELRALTAPPAPSVRPVVAHAGDAGPPVLGEYSCAGQPPTWVLSCPPSSAVRLNGRWVHAGIAVLRDRDEILLAGHSRLYFSTEEQAKVEPFPTGADPVFCARCRQSIQPGTPAVRCPSCGHWCEQSESKPCWSYAATCPMCEQPTAFDTGLRWTPEEM